MDDREHLARLIAASTQRCAVCRDESAAIEAIVGDDEERVRLCGLCRTCLSILRASPCYARILFIR